MSSLSKFAVPAEPRVELHDVLGLTGCEVSINTLPAGAAVPFVHKHTQNEEVYGVLEGRGKLFLDGEVVALEKGDWFRVAPEAERAITAASEEGISFVCIQTKAGSLSNWTMTDAVLTGTKAPWHK